MTKETLDIAKFAAGKAAADLIHDGMIIGLGSGSTAAFFIEALTERCRRGLKIQAVATSDASHRLAVTGGIPMTSIDNLTEIDITVDGADEITPQKQMIKGGGGALLREKIIAAMSKEMVVIVDEKKQVEFLGKFPLPVEIVPFAYQATLSHITNKGYKGSLRRRKDGNAYLTDNGNYIYDIGLNYPCTDPAETQATLKQLVGVVEVGLFLNLAGRIVVGYHDGSSQILQ